MIEHVVEMKTILDIRNLWRLLLGMVGDDDRIVVVDDNIDCR
jgi:hypothetical protein